MWFFLLFLVIPIIEITLFITIGGAIGVGPTILLVLLSALIGTFLMRRQGMKALIDVQESFRDLRDPTAPLAHGAMIILAGALLVTPGFFTDTLGLLLLIPAVRRWIMLQLKDRVQVTSRGFARRPGPAGPGTGDDRTDYYNYDAPSRPWPPGSRSGAIDGDFIVEDEPPVRPGEGSQGDASATPADPPRAGRAGRRLSGWTRSQD